jgi:hypothetical protein
MRLPSRKNGTLGPVLVVYEVVDNFAGAGAGRPL